MAYPISDVPRRIVYSGSAGVGPYAFTFEVLANTDIAVYKNTTLLTLTTDYTVSINTGTGTGTVTLVVAATAADTVTIVGDRAIQRTSDFVTGGDLFANTLNDELDAQTIYTQQVDEKADRAIRAPVTDPTTINMVLPSASDRAGKYLGFSALGNPIAQGAIPDVVYYGALAADPATRPNATASVAGDLYFNTAVNHMRVYSGSAWIDYEADAEAAAVSATASASTATTQASLATTAKVDAEAAEVAAQAAQTAAEAARDAAFANADVYPDIVTGRLAVADGEQFQVVSGSGDTISRYRRDSASTQTLVATYPTGVIVGRTDNLEFRQGEIGVYPGETTSAYTNTLAGEPTSGANILSLAGISTELLSAVGKVLTVDSVAFDLAKRSATKVIAGRIYRVRAQAVRQTDPVNPATSNVQLMLQLMNSSFVSVGTSVLLSKSLVVADGIFTWDRTFAITGTTSIPTTNTISASSIYARAFIRCNGTDHKTSILSIEVEDVTEILQTANRINEIQSRPGISSQSFTNSGVGAPESLSVPITSVSGVAVESVSGMGRALTITSAATALAPIQPLSILPGRVYKATFRIQRMVDPANPVTSSVVLQLQCMTNTFASNGVRTCSSQTDLTISDGVVVVERTFALDGFGAANISLPANTLYIRPIATFNGSDAKTAIDFMEVVDMTEALVLDRGQVWNNVIASGAKGDGTTDDRAAIAAADALTGGVEFPPGTYKVSSNLTISSNVRFGPGAILAPDAGVTVTLGDDVDAGWFTIFGGSGSIALLRAAAKVDWWGATPNVFVDSSVKVQAAFDAIPIGGTVLFGPCDYGQRYMVTEIDIDKDCTVNGFGQISTAVGCSNSTQKLFNVNAHNCTFQDMLLENNASGANSENTATGHVQITAALNSTRFKNVWFGGKPYYSVRTTNGAGEMLVESCTFDGAWHADFWGQGVYLLRVVGNYFGGKPKRSIDIQNTSAGLRSRQITIDGNVFEAVPETPIYMRGTDGCSITGNAFRGVSVGSVDDTWHFIDIDDCTGIVIDGNNGSGNDGLDIKHAVKLGTNTFANDVLIGENQWPVCAVSEIYHGGMFDATATGYDQPRKYFHSALPTRGTYRDGDFVQNSAWASVSSVWGWICTTAGTLGANPTGTATGTSGSRTVTMSNVTGLKTGQYIQIAGEPSACRIRRVNPVINEIYIYPALTGNRSNAAVTYVAAIFSAVKVTS